MVGLRCAVCPSEMSETSSRSMGEIGEVGAEVLLDASCGEFVYADGDTRANGERVPGCCKRGSVQTFSVGEVPSLFVVCSIFPTCHLQFRTVLLKCTRGRLDCLMTGNRGDSAAGNQRVI